MKKRMLLLIAVLLLSVTGCVRQNDNFITEGTYYYQESSDGPCKLTITEIDEAAYTAAKGCNVVRDDSYSESKGRYYQIGFYVLNQESNEYEQKDFQGLYYDFRTSAEPCSYEDENGNRFIPGNQVVINYGSQYYYLYIKEAE